MTYLLIAAAVFYLALILLVWSLCVVSKNADRDD